MRGKKRDSRGKESELVSKADERIEKGEGMVKVRRERAKERQRERVGEDVHSTLMEGEQRGGREKRNKVFYTAA